MKKQLVLMDHDSGVDNYLATMLLLTMEHIEILGIVVTPAECYIQPAVSTTRKIIDLMGFSHVPVEESTVRGTNPFPSLYHHPHPCGIHTMS
jgi:purine nucleosidase